VVPSAFGLATLGPPVPGSAVAAIAQNASLGNQLLSQTNAANPGEYLTLWGSGLGPVSGDETQYQAETELTNIPIEVDIGGVSATVTYHGRSSFPGVDQINVIVPAGISGCNVSVIVTAGNWPSNTATIPVAATGRTCSDPDLVPVTPNEYQTLLSRGNVSVGAISLTTLTTADPMAGSMTSDSAEAVFQKIPVQPFATEGLFQLPSMGSCLVSYGNLMPPWLLGVNSSATPLNAGPQINLHGPDGLLALPQAQGIGRYFEPSGTSPALVPSAGGTFTFDNGLGGADVGAFTGNLIGNTAAPLVWRNRPAIAAIDRVKGQSVSWTGGFPGDFVYIFGYSYFYQPVPTLVGKFPFYASFVCTAPLSAGQFTVPPAVLRSLPSTGSVYQDLGSPIGNGYLYVASGNIQRFTAPGLDLGLLFFGAGTGVSVPFH
jgi:hypothetical protein